MLRGLVSGLCSFICRISAICTRLSRQLDIIIVKLKLAVCQLEDQISEDDDRLIKSKTKESSLTDAVSLFSDNQRGKK